MRIPSRDGTVVAAHDLGGDGAPLLLAHATGFLGAVYRPLAAELAGSFRCWAIDFRAHGDADKADDLSWYRMAEDVAAVVDALGLDRPFGFGHSMGGAALTLAELDRPGTFRGFYLYEPVLLPKGIFPETDDGENPMSIAAAKRRPSFESRQAAYDNYSAKPPLHVLTPDALRAYVDDGFLDEPDGTVSLKCRPADEAAVFRGGGRQDGFDRLGQLTLPVTVAQGAVPDPGPGMAAPRQADAIPNGRHVVLPGLGHFGPVQDPVLVGRSVVEALLGG